MYAKAIFGFVGVWVAATLTHMGLSGAEVIDALIRGAVEAIVGAGVVYTIPNTGFVRERVRG